MIEQFFFALDEADRKGALTGRVCFSPGFDLKEINEGYAAAKLVKKGAKLFHRMFDFPKPLVACCAGYAVAAGVILYRGDYRIGSGGPLNGLNETAIVWLHFRFLGVNWL